MILPERATVPGRAAPTGGLRLLWGLAALLFWAMLPACEQPEEGATGGDDVSACLSLCGPNACGYNSCGDWCGACPDGSTCVWNVCVGDEGQSPADVASSPDVADVAHDAQESVEAPTVDLEPQPEEVVAEVVAPPKPGDKDGDGVADGEDNCPDTFNPAQLDFEGDGKGDPCDPDDDNDGDNDTVDCAHHDPTINSWATEICDGFDNDCDKQVDEMGATGCFSAYMDGDYDGYGAVDLPACVCNGSTPGTSLVAGDCDDKNPLVNPDVMETCNGKDDDCDGQVDEGEGIGCVLAFVDQDDDGYGSAASTVCVCSADLPGVSPDAGDCDDGNPSIHPSMTEVCDDTDNDCDGQTDELCNVDGDGYCTVYMGVNGTPAVCPQGGGDCNDTNPAINPGMPELAGDGLDNDCNGAVDGVGGEFAFECQGECTGHTLSAYLCAMEICFDELVISYQMFSPTGDNIDSAWHAVSHFGNAWNDLAPWAGESYALLASGPATGTSHTTDLPGGVGMGDPYAKDGFQTYDNVEFKVTLKAPDGAIGFSIDYIFFSEEYEEYIGSSFNDKFYILLQAPTTTQNQKIVINHTDCSNPNAYFDFIDDQGKKRCYIAINTAFSEPCSNPKTNISGTGFECGPPDAAHGSSTGWLSTAWPIEAGETFNLTFHIHDASDGVFDSEVILDNFKWLGNPFIPGTVIHADNP